MNFDNLSKMPLQELRVLAAQHGIKAHHKAKPETIARQIIEKVSEPKQEMKHVAEKPKEAVLNTEEQVREACRPYMAKDGFNAVFTDTTWHFSCRGSEDTGHMSVPLRIIKMKAEMVSHGARKPVMISIDGVSMMAAG